MFVSDSFSSILDDAQVTTPSLERYISEEGITEADVLLSIGGDGTLLQSVTHVGSSEIPILGINTGKLGFLATTSEEEIESAFETIFSGSFEVEDRTLLKLESNNALFDSRNFALNDFTVLKRDTSSMIVVHAHIDGQFLNSYWADGIIVSTPTGSTGYSLSCGGPILYPQSKSFIITPVSPHNLSVRPLVVPDESVLSFAIEGRSANFLVSLDSRHEIVTEDVEMTIKKENFNAKLVKLEGYNFFDTLRQKLSWGFDVRN